MDEKKERGDGNDERDAKSNDLPTKNCHMYSTQVHLPVIDRLNMYEMHALSICLELGVRCFFKSFTGEHIFIKVTLYLLP